MVDELARVERIYGCVAEYNRVMVEEQDEYEPSEAELQESAMQSDMYHEKIRLLNGKPSEFAVKLKEFWDDKEPSRSKFEDYNDYVRSGYDYAYRKFKNVIDKFEKYYNITFSDDDHNFYQTKDESFAISVEYTEHSMIKTKNLYNLDYMSFKNIFRDLYHVGLYPTMNYRCNNESHILSNCSLGNLRIYDLLYLELETREGLDFELKRLGFNEEKFKTAWKAKHCRMINHFGITPTIAKRYHINYDDEDACCELSKRLAEGV